MTRLLITLTGFLIFYFTYGFRLSQFDISVIENRISINHPDGVYDYKGVVNVHTDLSLGSSNQHQIIEAAKAAGLDFIVFTDFNLFDTNPGFEGYQGSTVVLVGNKYSYLDSRLIFYSPSRQGLGSSLGETQVRMADLLSQSSGSNRESFIVLAHPTLPGYGWSGEIPSGLDGVEVLNMKTMLQNAWKESKLSVIFSFIMYPFNPKLSFVRLIRDPLDEINLWDRNNKLRPFVGVAGSEASARTIPLANYLIRFPGYQRIFEFMTNHIQTRSELTGSFISDRAKIFQAIKNGNLYFSLDSIGDPKGFNCVMMDKGRSQLIGSKLKLSKDLSLDVKLPAVPKYFYEITIFKDGDRWTAFNVPEISVPITEPGTYRVEVRVSPFFPLPDAKKWMTWIFTNPFYVTK